MSDEGKKLYGDLKSADPTFKTLPVILFDAGIDKDTEGKQALARWLRPIGSYQQLMLGGKFDPTSEICDNAKVDDNGDGKADCDDASCKEAMACRTEKPKTLDLFVMSQCPYGAKAVSAMKEVVDNFKGDLALNVHYIGDSRNGELSSMHGPEEVQEDIRSLCAIKNYGKGGRYMDYLTCRAADYNSPNWETCTGKNGIDPKVIKTCAEKDGRALLERDFTIASGLGINASPTFLANNRHQFNGIDANTIKSKYCEHNQGLKGCEATLSGDTGAVPPGACQ